MIDKYDDAGILIRPIVKLDSEMDTEQLQIRMGEMAAEIERLQSVIDDDRMLKNAHIAAETLLLDKIEKLSSVIDAANAQEPIYQAQTVGGLWSDVTAENYAKHAIWRIVYARPISAQQSPAVAAPDALVEIAKLIATKYKEHTQKRTDARNRGDIAGDKAAIYSEGCMKMAMHFFEATQHLHGFGSPDMALAATCLPSPRITEQDALNNGAEVYLFRRKGLEPFLTCSRERFNELSRNESFETKILYENALFSAPYPHPRISEDELKLIAKKYYDWCNSEVIFNRRTMLETWVNDEGRAILAKLNKPESVGG